MKILTVIGARPQFIKAAVVSRILRHDEKICEKIIHTGQHYDDNMSSIFFDQLHVKKPDYNLGIGGGNHGYMTGRQLEEIEKILLIENPDMVVVYGDTNSTISGALAAVKLHIPVAHVEAGLRSFNKKMPEEINRILTDHMSDLLFAPTKTAVANLSNEGINDEKVKHVGDVMYDAVLYYNKMAKPSNSISEFIRSYSGNYYLATIHRQENTNDVHKLKEILTSLDEISTKTQVILPLHPRTKKLLGPWQTKSILITEPLGYFDILCLLKNCKGVFTDSGGLQKESFFLKKSCAILRDETEWVELVDRGFNYLCGTSKEKILDCEKNLFSNKKIFNCSLFGDGHAGNKIVDSIKEYMR